MDLRTQAAVSWVGAQIAGSGKGKLRNLDMSVVEGTIEQEVLADLGNAAKEPGVIGLGWEAVAVRCRQPHGSCPLIFGSATVQIDTRDEQPHPNHPGSLAPVGSAGSLPHVHRLDLWESLHRPPHCPQGPEQLSH